MAFNQNGSLPVSAVSSLSTKAAAPVIFTLTTDGKDLTQLFTVNGGNFAAGTIISIACNASRTAYVKAYNTSDVLYLTQDTSSGTALMTLSSETKRIWARVDSTTDVTFTVQPSKTVPTKILDIIRSSTTYTQGTDYTLGEKAHIIGVGSGGGGGCGIGNFGYHQGPVGPAGGSGAINKTSAVTLSGNYPIVIGAGGTGGRGGGNAGSPTTLGNAGSSTTGFGLTLAGGGGSQGSPPGGNTNVQGATGSPSSITDGIIFSTGSISAGSGLDPSGGVGNGGAGGGPFTKSAGAQFGGTGTVGGFFVLRYT